MPKRSYTDSVEPCPRAGEIPGALAQTEAGIQTLTDSEIFETIAEVCLRKYAPSLRRTGGSGDQQRDLVGGSLTTDDDELVVTVSLDKKWAAKIRRDLDGLRKHGHRPRTVWSVTSVLNPGAKQCTKLEQEAKNCWGHDLKIIDGHFLALRLLDDDLLDKREELLGLPRPTYPITRPAQQFAADQRQPGAPEQLVGRDEDLNRLVQALQGSGCVELVGPGGVGKTRLAIASNDRINEGEVRFLDASTPVDSDRLHAELAGAEPLVLVVDNAHRRPDLSAVLAILFRRSGKTRVLLIARPGFDATLRAARADTPVAEPSQVPRIDVAPLSNRAIGDLVRAAEPKLSYTGAIEQIVALAEGNPQIALIAHQVAVDNDGLPVPSRTEILDSYATRALDTIATTPINRAELLDCLALAALFGGVTGDDEDLLARLLESSKLELRRHLEDLADHGLMRDQAHAKVVAPDLLAAHLLHERFFGKRRPTIRFPDVWEAAVIEQRERLCVAIGGLGDLDDLQDHDGTTALVTRTLCDLANSQPQMAVRWAQSLASGLPEAALACIDAILAQPAGQQTARLFGTAMGVCQRVADITIGWPRQLAIGQAFYALEPGGEDKEIRDGLTTVYKRLPIDVSKDDGRILALVVDTLRTATTAWGSDHLGEPGAARMLALAARQMLTVCVDYSYTSPEDEMQVRMGVGFLPGNDRTRRLLEAGVHILTRVLPHLSIPQQISALKPLHGVRRFAGGAPGPFGSRPSADLSSICQQIIVDVVRTFSELELPLPTKAAVLDTLDQNPWPDDERLDAYRDLFEYDYAGEALEQRAERIAQTLTGADLDAVLTRWASWLAEADLAHRSSNGGYVIRTALQLAAVQDPQSIRAALKTDLARPNGLGRLWSGALSVLFRADDGEQLAMELHEKDAPATRVAVATGLAGTVAGWADQLLEQLADDDNRDVRRAVARIVGWRQPASPLHVQTGTRACLPDDLFALDVLLTDLARSDDPPTLDEHARENIRTVVLSAASTPRPNGDTLRRVVKLANAPRLAVEFLLARLAWLDTDPANVQATPYNNRFPEQLREIARGGAQDLDIEELCDRLQNAKIGASGRQSLIDLLSWLDPGDALSDRIAEWLVKAGTELEYTARQLLHETKDPDAFRRRVRRILNMAPHLALSDTVRDAREPTWFIGSEKKVMLDRAAEFGAWLDDEDERIRAIGAAARDYYAEWGRTSSGEEDDPHARAG